MTENRQNSFTLMDHKDCRLVRVCYKNGNTGLRLLDNTGHTLVKFTRDIPYQLAPNMVTIDESGNNKGSVIWLADNYIIYPTPDSVVLLDKINAIPVYRLKESICEMLGIDYESE